MPLNGIKEIYKDVHSQALESAILEIHTSYPHPKSRVVAEHLVSLISSAVDLQTVFELLCKSACLDRHGDSIIGDIFNILLDKHFEFEDVVDFYDEDILWTLLADTNEEILRTLTCLQIPSKLELGLMNLMCSMLRSQMITEEKKDSLSHFVVEIARALFPFSASKTRASILWNDDLFLLSFTDILMTLGKKLDVICPRNMEDTFLVIRAQIIDSFVTSNVRCWLVELCDQRASGWGKPMGIKWYKQHYAQVSTGF